METDSDGEEIYDLERDMLDLSRLIQRNGGNLEDLITEVEVDKEELIACCSVQQSLTEDFFKRTERLVELLKKPM